MKLNLIIGATSHTKEKREPHDFYATDPISIQKLLDNHHLLLHVWEPGCGQGHIAKVLEKNGHIVKSTDLIDRGYGSGGIDFLKSTEKAKGDILTNPPFKLFEEFVRKGMELLEPRHQLILLGRIQILESAKRLALFKEFPIKTVFVHSTRIQIAKNGEFKKYAKGGKSLCYCWFVWEKGYTGDTCIKFLE